MNISVLRLCGRLVLASASGLVHVPSCQAPTATAFWLPGGQQAALCPDRTMLAGSARPHTISCWGQTLKTEVKPP